jgi:hypothetical protein
LLPKSRTTSATSKGAGRSCQLTRVASREAISAEIRDGKTPVAGGSVPNGAPLFNWRTIDAAV